MQHHKHRATNSSLKLTKMAIAFNQKIRFGTLNGLKKVVIPDFRQFKFQCNEMKYKTNDALTLTFLCIDSDSDSDSDNDERDRKIHVEIKPLNNGSAPISASVDELRATVENLSLSPLGGALSV